MSTSDEIRQHLKSVWDSAYVQQNPKKSYSGYSPAEYDALTSFLAGGSDPGDIFTTKLGDGLYGLEKLARSLEGQQPEPPPTGFVYDQISDFSHVWNNGVFPSTGGQPAMREITGTPLGGGIAFMANEDMPAPWGSGSKLCYAKINRDTSALEGKHEKWSGYYRIPSVPNAGGLPGFPTCAFFEIGHTQADSGHHLMLLQDRYIRFGDNVAVETYQFYYTSAPSPSDAWIPFEMECIWSYGSAGYLKCSVGSQLLLERGGATIPGGQSPYAAQIGWYGKRELRNEIHLAVMQA